MHGLILFHFVDTVFDMTKPVVFVIGATGNVGASTVKNLSAKYADKVEIRAGVRNPEKADKIKSLPGVTVVQATMGDGNLVPILSGVDILFINTPWAENRAQLTTSTAELAKKAGVKHIAVVSVNVSSLTDMIIGSQFHEIEVKISNLGVFYTFIRLPFFFENLRGFKDTIVKEGTIYSPIDPDKPFAEVAAVEDGGSASADILANSSSYVDKAITIISGRQTFAEIAQDFSAALGKEVKYVQIPYEAARKFSLEAGIPEWQANAIVQFQKLVDSSNPVVSSGDVQTFTAITGEQPTDLKKWLAKYVGDFQ